MTQKKWTPGPWKVQSYISPPEHRTIVSADESGRSRQIARLAHAYQYPQETDGNAQLIAVAPELYQALEDVAFLLSYILANPELPAETRDTLTIAQAGYRSILKRATGEPDPSPVSKHIEPPRR